MAEGGGYSNVDNQQRIQQVSKYDRQNTADTRTEEERRKDAEFSRLVKDQVRSLRSCVEKNFQMPLGLWMEQRHKLYGEGQARYVYEGLAEQNIQKPWEEAALTFQDNFGIVNYEVDLITAEIADAEEYANQSDKFAQRQRFQKYYAKLARRIERNMEARDCIIHHAKDKKEDVEVPGFGTVKVEMNDAIGQHYSTGGIVANDKMINLYEMGDVSSLIAIDDKAHETPEDKLATLLHEVGHEHEERNPSYRFMDDRGNRTYAATEYISTLLTLQAAMMLFRQTEDPALARAVAFNAALYDWVVLGDPKNCIARRNAKAA